ncbi:predicted protein [Histoplasma capsulatum H143]|uniref:Uncharacterized protein n=1 Tax=Ajellomyces capsulatus (strain H143) TaxID=544712 RepID=C6HHM7_AJECH|nr:predicted protein [Histoplasma capsulatum H143]
MLHKDRVAGALETAQGRHVTTLSLVEKIPSNFLHSTLKQEGVLEDCECCCLSFFVRLQCCLSPLSSSGSPLVIEGQSRGSDGSPQQASQKTSVTERDGSDQRGLDERLGKILPSPLLGMSVDKGISAPIHVVKAKRATSAFSAVVRTPGWMESASIQTLCRLSKPTSRSRKLNSQV